LDVGDRTAGLAGPEFEWLAVYLQGGPKNCTIPKLTPYERNRSDIK